MSSRQLRIALAVHSTNPRGGVVHALEVGDALHDLGHGVVVHAPAPVGARFFRSSRCAQALVPARSVAGGLATLIGQRIEEYVDYFCAPGCAPFDIYHAQDGISGNALATLVERGVIPGYVRTVHHLDDFADARVRAWQKRSVLQAGQVFCVSRLWQDVLAREWDVDAALIPNGVDMRRFCAAPEAGDAAVRAQLGIVGGPVFLALGGVEQRKNTLGVFEAFCRILDAQPQAQLVIAGGASLLDHSEYRACFDAAVHASGITVGPGKALVLTGPLPDAQMPALYRSVDALVFPSLKEGFGLVVLEAMASGKPAIVSRIAPFTEYLSDGDCLWVDPLDHASIAQAMLLACDPGCAASLRASGMRVCRWHDWNQSARRHLQLYESPTDSAGPRRDEIHA